MNEIGFRQIDIWIRLQNISWNEFANHSIIYKEVEVGSWFHGTFVKIGLYRLGSLYRKNEGSFKTFFPLETLSFWMSMIVWNWMSAKEAIE